MTDAVVIGDTYHHADSSVTAKLMSADARGECVCHGIDRDGNAAQRGFVVVWTGTIDEFRAKWTHVPNTGLHRTRTRRGFGYGARLGWGFFFRGLKW